MPYLSGVLTGVLLTILVVFLIDHLGDHPDSQDIVRWGVVAEKVGAGAKQVGEEVREGVHEATEPEPSPEPAASPEPEPAPPASTLPDATEVPAQ
jgi:hypothetical protein